jgi:cobalt-zinc-cadmium efflux system protein
MSTTEVALSAHLVVSPQHFTDNFSKQLTEKIEHDFHISHVTLQLEKEEYLEKCKTQCA